MLPDGPTRPFALQFRGNWLARAVLRLLGWTVLFNGLPARQGVLVVYPHTSNWDFVVMILAKWSVGVQVRFWGKDRLFRIPLLGRWLRWLGGVPVDRTSPQGVVAQTVDAVRAAQERNEMFWLGLAPEGTRRRIAGWRTGFYRTAVAAKLPVGLIRLDFARREVDVTRFIHLSGDETADFARIAAAYQGVAGLHPALASPVLPLRADIPRTDTIVP